MTGPTLPATLPERLYLLTYDRGRERLTARMWAGYLLRAGALAELRSRGLVQECDGKVVVIAVRRLEDSVLGPVLESIASGPPRS
jgi:Golgi phosphoprotein 3 (GPP34)